MVKTQKEINARLKAYANGTVDSPYRVTRPTNYDNRFNTMEVGAIDVDKSYHAQCLDEVIDYVLWLTDNKVRLWGDARNAINNVFPDDWKIVRNEESTVPQTGWIAVYTEGTPTYLEFGHIGIVYNGGNTSTFQILEQNWDGMAGKKPQLRWDNYYGLTHFIVPPVAKNKVTAKVSKVVKETVKKVTNVTKSSDKMNILLVAGHGKGYMSNDSGAVGNGTNERDFIRKSIVPNVAKYLKQAGHTVSYYGGSSMGQDLYQDTAYGYNVGDTSKYGMYWVKKQKYDAIVEFHLDAASPAASGGHVIIGTGLAADKIDKGIQAAIVKHIGQIRPIDPRDNLLNVNVAKQLNLNYRLVELGFITSKKDMDKIKKDLQAYTKDIAQAIVGETIVPAKVTPKPKPTPKPASKKANKSTAKKSTTKPKPKPKTSWKWEGIFTCNIKSIKVRRTLDLDSKTNVVDSGSWIYNNQYIKFVELHKVVRKSDKKKHWVGKFKFEGNPKAGYFYAALGEITDKQEKFLKEKKLFGTAKVTKKK